MVEEDFYSYEPAAGHGLPHDPFNAIIGPRPIGWISTRGLDGSVNLAPYSFFNAFSYRPPLIGFSSNGAKDTLRNARETGEFGWNLVTCPLATAMNETSATLPYGACEFDAAGLTQARARLIGAPLVAESPVRFECRTADILELRGATGQKANAWLVIGEVIHVQIRQHLLKDGIFDTFGARIVLRAGGPSAYAEITEPARFDLTRPK